MQKVYNRTQKKLNDMPALLDKKGVERLLGTVNYLAKFIPNMSTVTKPIRDVLKADIMIHWDSEQKKSLNQ